MASMKIELEYLSASASGFFLGFMSKSALDSFAPWRLYFQREDRFFSPEKKALIKSQIDALGKKLGIKKNLEMVETNLRRDQVEIVGNTLFPGKAGIAINPRYFDSVFEKQQEIILAKSIACIKYNEPLFTGVLSGLAYGVTYVAFLVLHPSLAFIAPTISLLVAIVATSTFSKWSAERSDKAAFSICSKEAKQEWMYELEDSQIKNKQYRNEPKISILSSLYRKFVYTSEGNERFNIFYPSLSATSKYLKAYDAKNNVAAVPA